MAKCEVCGNDYDKSFQVVAQGVTHTFDSIECAARAIAPRCDHCGTTILGHGIEAGRQMFCCASCARSAAVHGARDRVDAQV